MTIIEHYNDLIHKIESSEPFIDDDIIFLKKRIKVESNKNHKKKLTANQLENERIMSNILDFMVKEPDKEYYTVSEIAQYFHHSNSKITSLLTKLKNDKKVFRNVEKGTALYKAMGANA